MPKLPPYSQSTLIPNVQNLWAPALACMDWTLETTSSKRFFLVSDEPFVVRVPSNPFDTAYVGLARGDLGVEVSFPISRTMCLIAKHKRSPDIEYKEVATSRVDEINLRSVVSAHRLIYSPEKAPYVDGYIQTVGDRGYRMELPSDLPTLLEWKP